VRKLRRVDPRRSAEVLDKIRAYTDRVVERLRPQCVLLFGSFARGDVHEGSDVDVLVVADFAVPFLDRIRLLLDLNDGIGLPLEPVGYTPEELRHMRATGNRFVQEVLETGQVLYGEV
jgi:predicted nucleotidyltransferase